MDCFSSRVENRNVPAMSFVFVSVLQDCRVCDAQGKQCRPTGEEPGEGISDADFVFYVSAMDTERCQKGMTVAYAAHCQQESSLDRSERLRSRFFCFLLFRLPPPTQFLFLCVAFHFLLSFTELFALRAVCDLLGEP